MQSVSILVYLFPIYRVSKVSPEVLEPQELREYLVKREILAHLDPMEIQYVHIYHRILSQFLNYCYFTLTIACT